MISQNTESRLFDLIKSMSRTEKGYFKKYSRLHGLKTDNYYLKLFDLIDKQTVYNEEAIRKKLKAGKQAANLAEAKYYLQKQILRSLQSYHSGSSVEMQLNEYLLQADILLNKALFDHCLSLCDKAKKLARQFEKYLYLLRLIWIERTVYNQLSTPFDLKERLQSSFDEESKVLEKLRWRKEFLNASEMVYAQYRIKGHVRSSKELQEARSEMVTMRKYYSKDKDSFDFRRIFHVGHHVYYNFTGDLKQSHRHCMQAVELFEAHADRLSDRDTLKNYFLILNQYIVSSSRLGRFEETGQALDKLNNMYLGLSKKQRTIHFTLRHFEIYHTHRLDLFLRVKDYDGGIAFCRDVDLKTLYEKHTGAMDGTYAIVLLTNIACIYMGAGQYNQAQYWINLIISGNMHKYREDVYCLVRIYELVVHYELGNMELLQSLTRSVYRYLRKHKKIYRFEELVLGFIRRLTGKVMQEGALKQAFAGLREQLLPLAKDPFEKEAFYDFDFIAWLDKKIGK